jgi:D-glycero-D-manno-heptose 1,7-bisphosphate phosphatase
MAAAHAKGRRALFLDRDGVVNEDTGFLHRIDECRFVDGIFALSAGFAARDFALVIATNQSGIGRGYFSEADFAALMEWMRGEFRRHGVALAAVYHCPDHPTAGQGAYRRDNPWRKPGPGMMLQAAADLSLDLARCWSIGDRPRDAEAARAAGIGTIVHYDPGTGAVMRQGDLWVVPRLADVLGLIAVAEG